MARLLGPDPSSRTITQTLGTTSYEFSGRLATVYTDEAGTVLADIAAYNSGAPTTPGASISGSQVRLDSSSRLPKMWFPADGTDTLYVRVNGLADVRQIDADQDARLDASTGKADLVYNVTEAPYNADKTGVADAFDGISAAITAAGATGTVKIPAGTYKSSGTLTFIGNVDASPDAVISYTGTGTAVQVGAGVSGQILHRKRLNLPQVVFANKPGTGWTASTIGVYVINLNRSELRLPRITGFETGLLMYGKGQGTAYVTCYPGHLDNNKVNQKLDADGTGWCNQNTFIAGSWSHNSGEGTNVSGTRHILLADITGNGDPNNNVWVNPSLESPTVVEFTLDIWGSYNIWLNPRFEFTSGQSKIRWNASAVRNWIFGGSQIDSITETHVSGSFSNQWIGTTTARLQPTLSQGMVIENGGSSANAAFSIMRTAAASNGDDPATAWGGRFQYTGWRGKKYNDTNDRVFIDPNNGLIKIGDATAAPTIQWSMGTGSPEGVVTAGIGSIYSRKDGGAGTSMYVKESGTGNTGWVAK